MKTTPNPIIDYGRGDAPKVPVSVEPVQDGFRIVINGRRASTIFACVGWVIVWMILLLQLLMTREWIGLIFLGLFVFAASVALVVSIQDLREKIVQYVDGELLILSPVCIWRRSLRCRLLDVRDIYARGECICVRLRDGRELARCKLGSEENVHATLQILRAMLPRRATPEES